MRVPALIVLLCLASGHHAAGQHATRSVLITAGFKPSAADTPEKLARLKVFPMDKFVARKTKAGLPYYIYADPHGCVCAYVGDQKAMDYVILWRRGLLSSDQMGHPPSGGTSLESEMIHDMRGDDAENEYDYEAFHPGF